MDPAAGLGFRHTLYPMHAALIFQHRVRALAVDHEMYRHYDTLWSQQFVAGGGRYWQKNQSAGAIALLGYGQRVQWNNVMDTGVMLNWDKRPYDGKRESNLSVTLDATLRF